MTANLRTIRSLPLRLRSRRAAGRRGARRGLPFAGRFRAAQRAARPGRSRDLRQSPQRRGRLDPPARPAIAAARPLDVWCYAIGYSEGHRVRQSAEALGWLREQGFRVNPDIGHWPSIDDVAAACRGWEARRAELDFDIDGVVVKVDEFGLQAELGASLTTRAGRSPTSSRRRRRRPASLHRGQRRSHRSADSVRGSRAGRGRRRDRRAGDAAQRGRHPPQGHPPRRRRDRAARRRRDPAGRGSGDCGSSSGGTARSASGSDAGARARRAACGPPYARPARSPCAAPTVRARRSSSRASSTS